PVDGDADADRAVAAAPQQAAGHHEPAGDTEPAADQGPYPGRTRRVEDLGAAGDRRSVGLAFEVARRHLDLRIAPDPFHLPRHGRGPHGGRVTVAHHPHRGRHRRTVLAERGDEQIFAAGEPIENCHATSITHTRPARAGTGPKAGPSGGAGKPDPPARGYGWRLSVVADAAVVPCHSHWSPDLVTVAYAGPPGTAIAAAAAVRAAMASTPPLRTVVVLPMPTSSIRRARPGGRGCRRLGRHAGPRRRPAFGSLPDSPGRGAPAFPPGCGTVARFIPRHGRRR